MTVTSGLRQEIRLRVMGALKGVLIRVPSRRQLVGCFAVTVSPALIARRTRLGEPQKLPSERCSQTAVSGSTMDVLRRRVLAALRTLGLRWIMRGGRDRVTDLICPSRTDGDSGGKARVGVRASLAENSSLRPATIGGSTGEEGRGSGLAGLGGLRATGAGTLRSHALSQRLCICAEVSTLQKSC
eukprot:CAMPEP_0194542300 /NCGR_PEP_ID=MMETSP0253-20130528/83773_1 /TAXON_ID=2966 /ORGANISM="Noctiluca scintillans" /LENGTH=184 /DNA_ID=CAMNT_0039388907 /DNA_START=378 /DNA_END=929 /DNA_ORIENTATION=-